jgi:hypothetical protein
LAVLIRPGGRLIIGWPRQGAGPWLAARVERRLGASLLRCGARLAGRLLVGLSAAIAGGPSRNSDHCILTAIAAVSAERTHETALDGLVHLVVLDFPAR